MMCYDDLAELGRAMETLGLATPADRAAAARGAGAGAGADAAAGAGAGAGAGAAVAEEPRTEVARWWVSPEEGRQWVGGTCRPVAAWVTRRPLLTLSLPPLPSPPSHSNPFPPSLLL